MSDINIKSDDKPESLRFHPIDAIDQYLVIRHTHPGHQVYEIGHELTAVGSTTDFMEAYSCLMKSTMNESVLSKQYVDFSLVASFIDQKLALDVEGCPENGTGLFIAGAYRQYNSSDQTRSWEITEFNNPCIPIAVRNGADDKFQNINTIYLHRENESIMNEKVYEYHKNDLKSRGVGDALDDALKMMLQKGEKQSSLYHTTKYGEDLAVATFQYNKSQREGSDLVFLNKIELLVKPKVGEIQRQAFDITRDSDKLTLKNAYNVMQGRSFLVNEDKNEWAYLDFKQTDKQGNHPLVKVAGYDVQKVVGRYQLDQLINPEEAQMLYGSLERGNRQMVSVNEKRFFIEALPLHDTIRVYKDNLQQTTVEALKEATQQKQKDNQALDQSVAKESNTHKNNKGQSIS
ncbi:hypothetical protein CLV59_105232 [Chitinophaga dinghuensis]|uniref:PAS domain-containing protein n=1 Tax=Chitinophaga dinghuensis TaxID=1539050 RepID=A0A327VYZ9_9BACT|nr:hypothetical protein [Chitinophaga dinghuensis]RAJ80125.1 hypothetical protein CLV59_105232 [Chitinophaga dinghuensis]